ncbi:flagellar motor switch protein FliN/FliY [Homoserinimonas aerilata]|uniref:Flagellar motor switch protein FliN/FliY n=1 Tax=Homoserinimonas aerilata TaxID=1162970 RepID=A0A542YEW0_9MICO|nr:flagellar motor switch protein FliN [Homoserinimonas aerilata]TQL46633.1 flagellar motor switch protein FliN/FliY [Homoserinimonas aerilata]
MTVLTSTLSSDAVAALVRQLPSASTLTPVVAKDGRAAALAATSAVSASFVGATAADVAIVLFDAQAVAAAAGEATLVSAVDVLRPALEAATGVLGSGVLGDAVEADASALFSDKATAVFELTSEGGNTAGWFAIRIRESGTVGGAARLSNDEVVGKLGRINNVEMALTVELGRTRMSVRDVLGLEPGAVIELDRSAGAPADILLNGRLIAHGEIVVVDQDYAVRITTILDVADGVA